jgi:hypothetical protein
MLDLGLRWVAKTLRDTCAAKFEGSGPTAVAGCLFLRFVCPALTLPVDRGIALIAPPPRVARTLLLLSKLLQSLANGAVSKKEPAMSVFTSFVVEQTPTLHALYDAFCALPPGCGVSRFGHHDEADQLHLPLLHSCIVEHHAAIDKSLTSYKQLDAVTALNDAIQKLPQAAPFDAMKHKADVLAAKQAASAAAAAVAESMQPASPLTLSAPSPPTTTASTVAAATTTMQKSASTTTPMPTTPKKKRSSLSIGSTAAAVASSPPKPVSSLLQSLKTAVT